VLSVMNGSEVIATVVRIYDSETDEKLAVSTRKVNQPVTHLVVRYFPAKHSVGRAGAQRRHSNPRLHCYYLDQKGGPTRG
jgi:hypothetical protein